MSFFSRNRKRPQKEVLDDANHIEDSAVKGMYRVQEILNSKVLL